jgi:hypothetical protein
VSLIIIWALGAVRDLADLGLSHSILERDRGIGLIAHQDLAVGEDDVVGAGLEKRRQPVGEIATAGVSELVTWLPPRGQGNRFWLL